MTPPSALTPAAGSPPPLPGVPAAAPTAPPPVPANATPPEPPPPKVEVAADDAVFAGIWSQMPSWLTSTVVHLALLLLLATGSVLQTPHYGSDEGGTVAETGTYTAEGNDPEALEDIPQQNLAAAPEPSSDELVAGPTANEISNRVVDANLGPAVPEIDLALGGMGPSNVSPLGIGAPGDGGDLMGGVGDSIGRSLQNRLSAGSRARLVAIGGGTPASEAAVDKGLRWLAEHQNADGSWSFDHRASPKCHGRCKDPGSQGQAKIAATAMALLPFLGTGETHHQGKYKKTIENGLYFLVRSTHVEGDRASLLEPGGRMYGHGLASIALCEAYGMTHDRWLQDPAQRAINFIVWCRTRTRSAAAGGTFRSNPATRQWSAGK